jgi:hypothetical protein
MKQREVANMDGCSLSMGASALACAIAGQLTINEINTLAAFLQVLGDALSLIAARQEQCENSR